jgi:hypothetical protein
VPGRIGQLADLFCRLRDYVGITKLVDKFHGASKSCRRCCRRLVSEPLAAKSQTSGAEARILSRLVTAQLKLRPFKAIYVRLQK